MIIVSNPDKPDEEILAQITRQRLEEHKKAEKVTPPPPPPLPQLEPAIPLDIQEVTYQGTSTSTSTPAIQAPEPRTSKGLQLVDELPKNLEKQISKIKLPSGENIVVVRNPEVADSMKFNVFKDDESDPFIILKNKNGDIRYKCRNCEKHFSRKHDLTGRHALKCGTIDESKKLKCTKCDYTCWKFNILKEHFAKVHTRIPLYYCDRCPKTFFSSSYYYTHKKKCNKNETPTPKQNDPELKELIKNYNKQREEEREREENDD